MRSILRVALLIVLLATAFLVACAPQEPAAPFKDEPAPTPTAEQTAFTDDFETGDTSEWSAEGAEEEPDESPPAEDPPADK